MSKIDRRTILAGLAAGLLRAESTPVSIPGKRSMILHNDYPEDLEMPLEYFNTWQTANDAFFVRQHLPRPQIKAETYRLSIDGLVNQQKQLALADLKKLPQHEVAATLECAGNGRAFYRPRVPGIQWSRGAVGNAVWRGPRLSDVLKLAGFKVDAPWVEFNAADRGVIKTPDFIRSLPMKKLLDPATILALDMNGETLPAIHGFPVRLIMPGWDGASWMKWVDQITVQEKPNEGFFMKPAYRLSKVPVMPGTAHKPEDLEMVEGMPVKSIIAGPADQTKIARGPVTFSGSAWAGEESIERVDVSTDGGSTWVKAELSPQKLRYAWRLWKYEWTPSRPGYHILMSRATDSAGRVQPIEPLWNPPGYLWNAIDKIGVFVEMAG